MGRQEYALSEPLTYRPAGGLPRGARAALNISNDTHPQRRAAPYCATPAVVSPPALQSVLRTGARIAHPEICVPSQHGYNF